MRLAPLLLLLLCPLAHAALPVHLDAGGMIVSDQTDGVVVDELPDPFWSWEGGLSSAEFRQSAEYLEIYWHLDLRNGPYWLLISVKQFDDHVEVSATDTTGRFQDINLYFCDWHEAMRSREPLMSCVCACCHRIGLHFNFTPLN